MHIEELVLKTVPLNKEILEAAQKREDNLIKPVGSLAKLEETTVRYAGIIGSSDKKMLHYPENRILLLWGTEKESEQLKDAFSERYPLSLLAKEFKAEVLPQYITSENVNDLIEEGAMLTAELIGEKKSEMICLGSLAPSVKPESWKEYADCEDAFEFLEKIASKDVSAMTGAILAAAGMRIPIMLDGVNTVLAAIAAAKFNAAVYQYCFAGHESLEEGMMDALEITGLSAPLRLYLHNGHGEGALSALTIFDAGIKVYKEMETFEEAGVTVEVEEFSLKKQQDREKAAVEDLRKRSQTNG